MRPCSALPFLALIASTPGAAAPNMIDDTRTITVSGDAEVKVPPDEVSIRLGVESFDKELGKAKKENDERIKKIIAVVKAAGVEERRIASDQISIEPSFESSRSYGRQGLVGYWVRRTLQVTLREVSKFDAVLSGALEAGANLVQGVDFTTTELRKHRDQARSLAIKAALEKATALAKELGLKPGKPRTINEGGAGFWGGYGYWGRGGLAQNVSQNAMGGGSEAQGTMAPGLVSVTASVTVQFDLE